MSMTEECDVKALPEFGLFQNYASREDLKAAALRKASEDSTRLRVYISQPGRIDRARIYLGCAHGGTKSGSSQCSYRIHATHNGDVWQVTKANFDHSHSINEAPPATPAPQDLDIRMGSEYGSQEDFTSVCERRAAHDKVDLRTFVNLGRLSRRARFAMSCAHGSKANAPKDERCSYSFVAIEYSGVWRVTQVCLEHNHPTDGPAMDNTDPTPPPTASSATLLPPMSDLPPPPTASSSSSSSKALQAYGQLSVHRHHPYARDAPSPKRMRVHSANSASSNESSPFQWTAEAATAWSPAGADMSDWRPSSSTSCCSSRHSLGDEWGATPSNREDLQPTGTVLRQTAPSLADLIS